MPLRKLLVPLLETPDDQQAVLQAVHVARSLGAHVTVLFSGGYLSELVSREPPSYARVKPKLQIEARALLVEQEELARREFEGLVREQGLSVRDSPVAEDAGTLHFEVERGTVPDAIQNAAVFHDAIVFSSLSRSSSLRLEAIKGSLQRSGRPVLILGENVFTAFGSTIAIAWNGSIEGAHAVTAAMSVLRSAKAVHVLTVSTQKTSNEQAGRFQDYLAWHGINALVRTASPAGRSAGATLLEMAESVSADLLISGAYTHNRVRQTILGGVTHHLVEEAKLSVFLAN